MMHISAQNAFRLLAAWPAMLMLMPQLGGAAERFDPHRTADLSRIVVVGDSLSAGFQNYSLFDSDSDAYGTAPVGGQKHGYAALIAQQAGVNLQLPLISYPGLPQTLTYTSPGMVQRSSLPLGSRENATLSTQTLNLSVPGFSVADALSHVVDVSATLASPTTHGLDVLTLEILGAPGLLQPSELCGTTTVSTGVYNFSAAACAVQVHPTTILVSLGNNDVLKAVIDGVAPGSLGDFGTSYSQVLAELGTSGATLVLANIPDVTAIPLLVPYASFVQTCQTTPVGANPGDYLVPNILALGQTSFDLCTNYSVRSGALIARAHATVRAYNLIIQEEARRVNAVVVNMHRLFAEIVENGYDVNGHHLTAQQFGGIFSLDGVHPTNTGYGLMANEFIQTMNRTLNTQLQPVSISSIASTDPLIF